MTWLAPLLVGIAFGFLLDRAGLDRPERIIGVYRLTDLTVLKFLGSAIVAGAVIVQSALTLGLACNVPVVPTHLAAQALGGALFGVGMAGAGFCPGTIVAGAGAGRMDALLAGGAGLFFGALGFGFAWPLFQPALARLGALGAATAPAGLGLSGALLVALLAELALLGFYVIERWSPIERGRAHRARHAVA